MLSCSDAVSTPRITFTTLDVEADFDYIYMRTALGAELDDLTGSSPPSDPIPRTTGRRRTRHIARARSFRSPAPDAKPRALSTRPSWNFEVMPVYASTHWIMPPLTNLLSQAGPPESKPKARHLDQRVPHEVLRVPLDFVLPLEFVELEQRAVSATSRWGACGGGQRVAPCRRRCTRAARRCTWSRRRWARGRRRLRARARRRRRRRPRRTRRPLCPHRRPAHPAASAAAGPRAQLVGRDECGTWPSVRLRFPSPLPLAAAPGT